MVKLLDCQEELAFSKIDRDELKRFAIALICSLLDTFEKDLSVRDELEIETFCRNWEGK